MNRIELKVSGGVWVAVFSGPIASDVIAVVGTDTIETPFLASAEAGVVLAEISRRNPDCSVSLK